VPLLVSIAVVVSDVRVAADCNMANHSVGNRNKATRCQRDWAHIRFCCCHVSDSKVSYFVTLVTLATFVSEALPLQMNFEVSRWE